MRKLTGVGVKMKFTLAWLKEYLDFKSSVEDLCEKLTSIGLEVENVKNPKNHLSEFLVSEILSINAHPNADRLKVCDVNNGNEILKIVCGAANVKEKNENSSGLRRVCYKTRY